MFGLNTVNRFEGGINSRENNIGRIRVALEKAGIKSTLTAKVSNQPPEAGKASGNNFCAVPSRPRVA